MNQTNSHMPIGPLRLGGRAREDCAISYKVIIERTSGLSSEKHKNIIAPPLPPDDPPREKGGKAGGSAYFLESPVAAPCSFTSTFSVKPS